MRQWTSIEIEYLIKNYSKSKIQDICSHLGFSRQRIYDKAQKLGLKKTVFFTTVTEKSKATQFKKGCTGWNKGLKLGADWNKATQFKKGQTAWNKLPEDVKEISLLNSKISKIVKERNKRYEKRNQHNSGFAE
jgi:hypothetical protein